MNTPEIEELKLLIEQKYGKTLGTTTDFEEFSVHLSHDTGQNVSASTLKRLWGYVNDSHKPRMFTLDILAQYLGHANYYAFVSWLKTSTRYNSSFFNAKQLISNELDAGTEVEIGWSPTAWCACATWARAAMRWCCRRTASSCPATASSQDASSRSSRSICPTSSDLTAARRPLWQAATAD